ncbi:MAG: PEP-CTERM sorting domain-containing protein [Pirellulaceae bacterium]|nr:PEP-CTERM sorting domain-containing protein [Planctomycetales bacterium]
MKGLRGAIAIAVLACSTHAYASTITIMKFGFGADSAPDLGSVGGILSTVDDGDAATPGDQATGIDFLGHLGGIPSIPVGQGSITIDGISLSNTLQTMGPVVLQPTSGGTFHIWDDTNALLLSGTFGDGLISGSTGPSATGSLITLNLGTFDGGSLLSLVDPNSAAVSLSFTAVNNGAGFTAGATQLNDFTTDATGLISASVPEPATLAATMIAGISLLVVRRRRS